MATIINTTRSVYQVFHDLADHRTDNWLLMDSPWPTMLIVVFYVYFVKYLGPQLMKDRPAFNVDRLVNIYNTFQICVCAYLVERGYTLGWGTKYKWICEPVDYSENEEALQIVRASYHYYLLKLSDLLDTVFFILRKKNSQVTFLHVYHHSLMALGAWGWVKFLPGGHGTFMGVINCFVHVWMYTYYLVTSLSPQSKKNIWWKKHITQLQMAQFIIVFFHSLSMLLVKNCGFPRLAGIPICLQSVHMFFMFYRFYRRAYSSKKSS